jgi:integrase
MTLSAIMREAVEDQLLATNPLRNLSKALRLDHDNDDEDVKALTQPQLVTFLVTARVEAPDVFPAFAVMGLAGLRVGEAMALRSDSLDLQKRKIRVRDQLGGTRLKTKQSRRDVDISAALAAILMDHAISQAGTKPMHFLFPTFDKATDSKAEQRMVKLIRRRMQRVLEVGGLPRHHTPHSLRHTFASVLLSKGFPIEYVQLGHASIQLTADTYGRWLPGEVSSGALEAFSAGLVLDIKAVHPPLPVAKTPQTVAAQCIKLTQSTNNQ